MPIKPSRVYAILGSITQGITCVNAIKRFRVVSVDDASDHEPSLPNLASATSATHLYQLSDVLKVMGARASRN